MTGFQTYQKLSEETLEEHRQIHFFLDQVRATLETLGQGISDVEPIRRLAAQLDSLLERLKEHQHDEEQGRLYPAILEVLPEAREELIRLRQQHEKMVEVLELARIHAQYAEPSDAHDLKVDLERFLDMIREHEEAEERLLEQAIEREKHSHT